MQQQQYHVVWMPLSWVGLKWGWGRRASSAVHGSEHGMVRGCMGGWCWFWCSGAGENACCSASAIKLDLPSPTFIQAITRKTLKLKFSKNFAKNRDKLLSEQTVLLLVQVKRLHLSKLLSHFNFVYKLWFFLKAWIDHRKGGCKSNFENETYGHLKICWFSCFHYWNLSPTKEISTCTLKEDCLIYYFA